MPPTSIMTANGDATVNDDMFHAETGMDDEDDDDDGEPPFLVPESVRCAHPLPTAVRRTPSVSVFGVSGHLLRVVRGDQRVPRFRGRSS